MRLVLVLAVLVAGGCTSDRAVPEPCPDAGVDASGRRWTCTVERWCADGSYSAGVVTLPEPQDNASAAALVVIARCESVVCTDMQGRAVLSRCHASCSPATE